MPKIPHLVTPSIPDIAPPLRARRPLQTAGAPPPSTRRSWRVPALEAIQECVVDATPPSLPEIGRLKAAVVRSRVCDGLGYLLPTDRSRVSVTSNYRVELAAMFRRPYAGVDPSAFDDDVVRSSAAVHLRPGGGGAAGPRARRLVAASAAVVPSVAAAAGETASGPPINAASATVYDRYRLLTPKRDSAVVSCGDGGAPLGGSARSAVRGAAAPVPLGPAEVALKEQVENILASCGVRDAGGLADASDDTPATADVNRSSDARRAGRKKGARTTVSDDDFHMTSGELSSTVPAAAWSELEEHTAAGASGSCGHAINPRDFRGLVYARKSSRYATHQDLLDAPVPRPQPPPSVALDAHLNPSKAKDIWDWLTSDFHMTPFEHFISVCS